MFAWTKASSLRLMAEKASKLCITSQYSCYTTGPNSAPSVAQINKQFLEFEGGEITLNKDDKTGIATICIDNVSKRNSITGKMMVNLSEIVSELKTWTSGKAVMLHSANSDIFCSGGDLATVKKILNSSMGARMSKLMHDTTTNLLCLPLISVAVIEGPAIGGGAELTTACDFRLMSSTGSIQFVQGRLGVATGWGGGTRLVKLLGRTKALRLLASGHRVKAKEGIDIGLVDDHINGGVDQAHEWLLKIVDKTSPQVLHTLKKIVITANDESMENSLLAEKELFANIWGGKDHLQALDENLKHR